MILKRAAALALAIPLLHLNVQRADVACASHDRSQNAPAQPHHPAAESHSHGATAPAPSRSTQDESCNVPTQRDCCHAVVSCSVAIGLGDAASAGAPAAPSAAVVSATSEIPVSRVAAPDPPPPKA